MKKSIENKDTSVKIIVEVLDKLMTERNNCDNCGYRKCFGPLTKKKLYEMKRFRMN